MHSPMRKEEESDESRDSQSVNDRSELTDKPTKDYAASYGFDASNEKSQTVIIMRHHPEYCFK